MPRKKPDEGEVTRLRHLLASRSTHVIGIDEVGMGAWAGPIVVTAVVLPADWTNKKVKDSKRYSNTKKTTAHQKRKKVLDEILRPAIEFSHTTRLSAQVIDAIGLEDAWRRCSLKVARECRLRFPDAVVAVDGSKSVGVGNVVALPGGDDLVPAVSAASILAKVTRDSLMKRIAEVYPDYSFETHVGYGTPEHQRAIESLGLCPVHRRSFRPIQRLEAKWQTTKRQENATSDSTS